MNGYGLVPVANKNPFSVGAYVTGAQQRGIRNYGMNVSPLNFSNIEYDGNGTTAGSKVTIDLAGGARVIRHARVSAALRPAQMP